MAIEQNKPAEEVSADDTIPASAETPAPAETPIEEDDTPRGFDDVFASFTKDENEADNKPERTDVTPEVREATKKPDAAKASEPDPEPVPDPEPEPEPAPEPAREPAGNEQDILARLAQLVQQPQQQEQPRQPQVDETNPLEGIYTEEEAKFLQGYDEEWGDVSKGEALKRRAEYTLLTSHIYDQIATALMPHFEVLHAMADQIHLKDLTERVENYGDIRDKVIEWVGQQPEYLQVAYNRVIEEGTVDEVTDLIGRYQQATAAVTPAQRAAPAPAPAKKPEPELPASAKKAAASLAPVSSKRSNVVSGTDPNDFDGAFADFADKV